MSVMASIAISCFFSSCLSFPERPWTNPISVNAVNVLVAVEGCLWLSSIKLFSSRVKYAPLCVKTHASFVDTINLSVLLSRCSQSASSWCQMNASTCDHRSFHSMATKPAEMCCFKKIKSFSTYLHFLLLSTRKKINCVIFKWKSLNMTQFLLIWYQLCDRNHNCKKQNSEATCYTLENVHMCSWYSFSLHFLSEF